MERGELTETGGKHFLPVTFKGAAPKGNLLTQGENASELVADSGTNPSDEYTALYQTASGSFFKVIVTAGEAHGARQSIGQARSLFELLGRQGRQWKYAFDLREMQDKMHKVNQFNRQERLDKEAQELHESEHGNRFFDWFMTPGRGHHL